MTDLYYTALEYRGRGGAVVEFQYDDQATGRQRQRWFFNFAGMGLRHGPYRNKLEALCVASWMCGRSARSMDWQPSIPKSSLEKLHDQGH